MSKKKSNPRKIILKTIVSLVVSVVLISLITVVYFLTLISTEYKSFPFVTTKIEEKINQNLAEGLFITVGKSSMKFDDFHKIRIKINDIKLTNSTTNEESTLPETELDFSLFKLLLLKTIPSKIKIIGPQIEVDQTSGEAKIAVNGIDEDDVSESKLFESLSKTFVSLENGTIAISKFYILNGKVTFKNVHGGNVMNLNRSVISTSFHDGYLNLKSDSELNFEGSNNIEIITSCDFKKSDGLKCNADFKNFVPKQVAFLSPKIAILSKIKGMFDGKINFSVDENYQISSAAFSVESAAGNFELLEYFKEKIAFTNLVASGKVENGLKNISLDNLECNFGNAKFAMSFSANDFMDPELQKTVMQFKIGNVKTNDLDLLWPIFLNHNGVRSWVISHIKGGTIADGYASMIMEHKNGISHLQKIESELAFSGLNLEYDKQFPPISNIKGIAHFNDKMMRVDISAGNVLNSKINFASVTIPNFAAKKTMLEIDGKMIGAAEDSLKHIDYKSEFAQKIPQYFSGNAQTSLNIKLPIIHNLDLKHVYIKVSSDIGSFNNNYIKDSKVNVLTKKEVGNNNFITEIDLRGANLNLKQFGIEKKSDIASKIKTVLSFDDGNLYLRKFEWNQENKYLSGNLTLRTDPLEITELNLNNSNFVDSNFDLNYKVTNDLRSLKLKGKSLNLAPIMSHSGANIQDNSPSKHYPKNDFEIDVAQINLANGQKFKDVKADISCDLGNCQDGFIVAKMDTKNSIDLRIIKSSKKDPSRVKGTISDISILAKALDLSNQLIDGNALLKIRIEPNGKMYGKIDISDGFTVLKNDVVEKISSNSAFAELKKKIQVKNKIEFDSLEVEFDYQNSVLDVNKLIASSYLLGLTAKGRINLDADTINVKGLIVPGYALNKLFGIGKIPVLGKIIVGEEGGGIFALRYDYIKKPQDQKGGFTINPASAVIPGGIRNVFDLF